MKGDHQMEPPKQFLFIRVFVVIVLCLVAVCLNSAVWASSSKEAQDSNLKKMTFPIHWLGHDSFRIDGDKAVIYLDPFKIKEGPKADLILITHDHFDHCSPADVAKIQKTETVIVTVAQAAAKLSGQIKTVKPGDELTVKGIQIKTIPAYNINKFRSPGIPFHPKDSNYVGFIIKVGGQSIYHAGDSDFIPEMKGLGVDIALLPVSGTYVMTVDEAVEAAKAIHPNLAIPMHIGGPVGSLSDGHRFIERYPGQAIILPLEN
jgi:L-ascorbate metabolism protein UlaG (beta-lactamase superfamily)